MQNACILKILLVIFFFGAQVSDVIRSWTSFLFSGYADVKPQYYVTMENIESVLSLTTSCQQYIKYECNRSQLTLQRKN